VLDPVVVRSRTVAIHESRDVQQINITSRKKKEKKKRTDHLSRYLFEEMGNKP
jgi:hypothetical protein